MTARKKTGIPANHTSTAGQGFGDFQRPARGCDGQSPVEDHRNSGPPENLPTEPEITTHEAAATLATQTLENAAESLVARSYSRHQAVGQLQTLSSQLALQDAAEDYFVLSGAHYENEYRRNLAALAAAEQAFQQEFNFQRYLDHAIEQRAKLPSASRAIAELKLLEG